METIDVAVSQLQLREKPNKNNPAFWRQFNASFRNQQIDALDLLEKAATGHAFTAWLKKPWRALENYDHAQVIALDFDTGDAHSDPERLYHHPLVERWGSFIYTTFSHQDDAPRCRVVFTLDTPIYQPKNFKLAASALIWLFGGQSDPASRDPVRGFFGGPPGKTDVWWIGKTLPLELVKAMIRQYQATGATARKRLRQRAPAPHGDLETVQDALRFIDPWSIDYDDWVRVLMAIHAVDQGAAGMAVAEAWADALPGEIEIKWRSFDPSRGITPGFLYRLAMDRGWNPPWKREYPNLSQNIPNRRLS